MTILTENSQSQNNTSNKLLDGPKQGRFVQTVRGILNPLYYLEKNYKTYGDIFTTQFSNFPPQVVISNPQAIQEIFTADSKFFESGTGNQVTLPLVGPNSLLLLDGDQHLQQRKLLMPPLHGERMKAYGEIIRDITEKAINTWTPGNTFVAQATMQNISLDVILHAVFGLSEGERYQQIHQLMVDMFSVFSNPLNATFLLVKSLQKDLGAWSPWGRFLRQRQRLDELLYQEIRDRKTQSQPLGEDILSLLVSARDEAGEPMSDVELRDELMTMLFAGHETTATALAWALYWIHYLPEVREKLLQELSSIDVDNCDGMEIAKLPYLNAVCSETLRIYPIVFFAFPRVPQAPMQLMGYDIPKGVMLSTCIYLVHHREDLYPEPNRFKPERFLERQFSPYEYLPFGGGNRRCIGAAFAMFEMKLVLAKVLSRYSLELAENRPILPVRRGLTMAPAGGVRLVVKGSLS
ncbi:MULTISPECIES: cytochrome P450 [unclassified Microcoleus]|uniref:cytochrome P450 n=1 Tax=unclassified Microcoleus TaxID=2642155 RepID=UPI001DDBA7F1|nr:MULTISPECIES: cytochrome P450 [unclassified Microcoleus]MCC3430710.1 cytochrome P450 [Microcoleus sp. PH2017_04_SCI_O_A]MCC3503902.1 cytochrome P450 [Microcoleus sp. PH2017_19_SFW_U_A]TAG96090.1 MAG: cytochrome P450 [Oscillatoriales cyanobacterium]MCC3521568.1 cytochrome P450 [Microcoleus sp. PH2017_20_SFW_D_A]MCC3552581.1 cytochrome P450 [Microcoleus sp. PH2017_35_SFW_U_B]